MLELKVGYCIQALLFGEFTRPVCKFFNFKSWITNNNSKGRKRWLYYSVPLFDHGINNIAVICNDENRMFTTRIDIGEESTSFNKSKCYLEQVEFYEEKNYLTIDNKESGNKITKIKLEDKESHYTKLGRWLIGINWNTLNINSKESDPLEVASEYIEHIKGIIQELRQNSN